MFFSKHVVGDEVGEVVGVSVVWTKVGSALMTNVGTTVGLTTVGAGEGAWLGSIRWHVPHVFMHTSLAGPIVRNDLALAHTFFICFGSRL